MFSQLLTPDVFLWVPALIIAFSFHEFAHAYVSNHLGDPTPRLRGRLTLNPMAHIDPIGFLMLLLFRFGWAKPVVVNPYNYRHRERGYAYVALAGPVMNLLLAFVSTFLLFASARFWPLEALLRFLQYLVMYNIYLAVFNLIPIPPLDGSKLLFLFLPRSVVYRYLDAVQQYGFLILILLISSGAIGRLIGPFYDLFRRIFFRVVGILFGVSWY
ncbi:MAG: site-2 protease family protein [Bacillota bacterium]